MFNLRPGTPPQMYIVKHRPIKTIDKLDDRPWDIVAAFKDLHQRLAMLDFCQNNIVIDYEDIQPDHVVVSHDA